MLWTNQLGLPEPIARAVRNDSYDPGEKTDFSVTTLIGPPRIRVLRKRYRDELTEDVADRLYSLLGQSVHTILERAATEGALAEVRLYAKVDGLVISGQLDHAVFFKDQGLLQDYKLTSIWTDPKKPEWVQQINMLAWLLRANKYNVTKGQIVPIYRDWSKARARREKDYPQHQSKLVDIELWPDYEVLRFVRERIKLHVEAETEKLPECTSEERWYRGEKFAVMKKGNKRAVKLFDFRNEAEAFIADGRFALHYLEVRPGENVRCQDFCQVAEKCSQWAALKPKSVDETLTQKLEESVGSQD